MEDLSNYKLSLINEIESLEKSRIEKISKAFIPWEPKAKPFLEQKAFFTDTAKTKLVRCGNRAAKTFSTMRDLAWKLMRNHPYRKDWNCTYETSKPKRFWVLAPTFEFITKVAWEEYLEKFIPAHLYTNSDGQPMIVRAKAKDEEYVRRVTFLNGDTLELRTYTQNIMAQMGRAIDEVVLDEMPPNIKLLSEVIVRTADRGGGVNLGFTPLVEDEEIQKYCDNHPSISTHSWSVLCNPVYANNPEKMDRLLNEYAALPVHLKNARLSGDWYFPDTGDKFVFSNVVPHVVTDFVIPLEWRQIRFTDPAASTTGAIFAAEDPEDGTWYVHTAIELSWEGIFATTKHIEDELEKYRPHAGFEYFYSKYDNHESWFAAHSVGNWYPCTEKNKEMAITSTRNAVNSGKVKFFKFGAALALRQIQTYRKKANGRIQKKDDHALDCLMYFCREIPSRTSITAVPQSDDRKALIRYHVAKALQSEEFAEAAINPEVRSPNRGYGNLLSSRRLR
jgi:hypothetical protein